MASYDENISDGMLGNGSKNPTPVLRLRKASKISVIGDVTLNFGGSGAKLQIGLKVISFLIT